MIAAAAVVRMFAVTHGRRAAERALPLALGIFIVAMVLVAGNGLSPRDVTRLAARSPAAAIALWITWLLLAAAPSRALIAERSILLLRSLPRTRAPLITATAAGLLVIELPWGVGWAAGDGVLAGVAAALVGAAISAFAVAGARGVVERVALVALAVIAIAVIPHALRLALAIPLFAIAVRAAWRRGPDGASPMDLRAALLTRPRSPVIAIAIACALRLVRVDRSGLVRGLVAAIGGGVVAAIASRNRGAVTPGDVTLVALVASVPSLMVAASGVAGPVRIAERELAPVVASSPIDRRVAWLAARVVPALWIGACGAIIGLGCAISTRAPAAIASAAACSALGVLLGAAASIAAARADQGARAGEIDGGLFVALLVAITILALASLGALGALGLAPIALVVAAAMIAMITGKNRPVADDGDRGPAASILDVRGVRKMLGGRFVLDGVRLAIDAPSLVVIAGENGAGKSTLLRVVAGVTEPDEGEVILAGASLARDRDRALSSIGYVPDVSELPGHLVARELVALIASLKRASMPGDDIVDMLSAKAILGERIGALSLGQKRRAAILAALTGDPMLLVLDEPTNGLDRDGIATLASLVQRRLSGGRAALIATHDRAFAEEIGAEITTLEGGKLR